MITARYLVQLRVSFIHNEGRIVNAYENNFAK